MEDYNDVNANFAKLSEAIGSYIITFEQLMSSIKNGISFMLFVHDMFSQNVVDVLLADMTSDPLLKRLDGLIAVTMHNELKDVSVR